MRIRTSCFTVAVDFDGTLTKRLPGDDWKLDPVAVAGVRELHAHGVHLFLYTARVGADLKTAIKVIQANGLPIHWGAHPVVKPVADFYIDDKAVIGGVIDWRKTIKWILTLKGQYDVHNSEAVQV